VSPASSIAVLRLASRGSALALVQARLAAEAIEDATGAATDLVVVRTGGDRNHSTPIQAMEGQGWFTAEIERAVLAGEADVAVHSAKDLPTELAPGLEVVALLPRADASDALVTRGGGGLDSLTDGSTVGTSSRRRAQLLAATRPGLRCVPIRGNVDTRMRKLADGEVDALLVASAGLDRLGLSDSIAERLDPRQFVPAPAQGAIALEARSGTPVAALAARVGDAATAVAVRCEREVLARLGGGCLLPLGVWARFEGGALVVSAALAGEAGVARVELRGDVDNPAQLAEQVVRALR
jgi:hydroxymethylbilane synthase